LNDLLRLPSATQPRRQHRQHRRLLGRKRRQLATVDLDVTVLQGGEAEAAVLSRVVVVADADQRRVQSPGL
jgi:hypothetical protein